MEKRHLLAFILIAAILAVWSAMMSKQQPRRPIQISENVATSAEATPEVGPVLDSKEEQDGVEPTEDVVPEESIVEQIVADVQQTVVLENEDIRVELTNRGAAISSLVLKGYLDDEGRPLDLVQTVDHKERTLPLQCVMGGETDQNLYVVEVVDGGRSFRWSDGIGKSVEKVVRLANVGYGLDVVVKASGYGESTVELSIGTGLRNRGPQEEENRFSLWGQGIVGIDGEIERVKREKARERTSFRPRTVAFAGFEDTYFVNVFRPVDHVDEISVKPLVMPVEGEDEGETVLQVLLSASSGEFGGELLSAPKQYDLLHQVGGGVEGMLDFGFFHPISVFFLRALQWTYGVFGNYGVAIILLTLAIRILLFPLMHTSTVSMRKMQKLQPKVKGIQEKYKKNKTDPQVRAKMNQEMMELYKVEGVNPMSGCLPLLIQLPILWALYTLFAHAIELRHAPFIFWIQDLSAKDPYYITPVLMTATMWLQQKLAPQAGDPQQQRIFRMMPLIFGIMFLGFPSGLVLYWLTNNVLTIAQQEVTLRLIGERGRSGKQPAKGRSSKK
ncbi:MAG: membrane protein insertase YidC [bacterium]|nr:membrane protein insertase YidC [bacterium]